MQFFKKRVVNVQFFNKVWKFLYQCDKINFNILIKGV